MTFQRLFTFIFSAFLATSLYAQSEDTNTENEEKTEQGSEEGTEEGTEEGDSAKTTVSYIEIPNAFSPNQDGYNDDYHVTKHANITEFRAIIFNRWGQKLYEWTDINGKWDGTHNGQLVKQGTYFVLINAKGSDGKVHTIKRDVNVLYRVANNEQQ